ncbi:hypothetical protein JZ751_001092, partial [Albula glossodonta]
MDRKAILKNSAKQVVRFESAPVRKEQKRDGPDADSQNSPFSWSLYIHTEHTNTHT